MLPLRTFTTFTSPKLNVLVIPILSTLCSEHFDSAQNVCRQKAAQISLVQVSQLEDILCADILLEYESFNFFIHIFTIIIRAPKYLNLTVPTQRFTAHGG